MAFIKSLWLQTNISLWFITNSLYYLHCSLASFKGFMVYNNYSYYICHVKMQLNDVIKIIGWYWAFVALLIQTNTTENSTDTDTGIGISASLATKVYS